MAALNLVVIRAECPKVMAGFYAALGLEFQKHRHGDGPEHLSCEMDAFVFEIYPAGSSRRKTAATRLGFAVDSLDDTLGKLRQIGAEIVSEPRNTPWDRVAVVSDPEGHQVEITQTSQVE